MQEMRVAYLKRLVNNSALSQQERNMYCVQLAKNYHAGDSCKVNFAQALIYTKIVHDSYNQNKSDVRACDIEDTVTMRATIVSYLQTLKNNNRHQELNVILKEYRDFIEHGRV